MSRKKLTCAITMGDPAGIGPEIVLKSLKDNGIQRVANFCIIGNSFVINKTAKSSRINLKLNRIKSENELKEAVNKGIALLEIGNISSLKFGRPLTAYGLVALDCIDAAVNLSKNKKIDVLVTAPVNKHTISQTGHSFVGHTEYLAHAYKLKNFAMMLIGGPFKVVLVTRHLALKDVPKALTKERIYWALDLTVGALKRNFGIRYPRIGVCGLNPHSGEGGVLGEEEDEVIRPAVIKAKRLAFIEGPLAADTLFYSALHKKFDAIVAMYHDQGLIPLKTYAFHQGVNLTLGLPFVRTSPDHGTAYDIAGKNKANPSSMMKAIRLAVQLGLKAKAKN